MSRDVTDLLLQWNVDNKAALDELIPIVADELKQMAAKHLRDENRTTPCNPRPWSTRSISSWWTANK